MFGDPPAHPTGLLAEIEGLRKDIQAVKNKRPSLLLWGAGYVVFLVSGAFAMTAFYNHPVMRTLREMPADLALAGAILFAALAAVLFVVGYGWLNRG